MDGNPQILQIVNMGLKEIDKPIDPSNEPLCYLVDPNDLRTIVAFATPMQIEPA
jgi:hypothetical protein